MTALNILFITSNRIGDAVLSTGLLAWMIEAYPTARFTIACGPLAADLFRAVPRLERLILLRKKSFNRHWLGLWKACLGTRWDLILDIRDSAVSRLLWAKRRGYPARRTGAHKVVESAAALSLDPPPAPTLWLDAEADAAADRLMPPGQTVLALGPAANWPCKQWPIENFITLAHNLTHEGGVLAGASLLIVAAPHERDQVEPLLQAFPASRLIDAVGQNLLTAAACLKRCRLYVGNDSGLMHMASALRIPTLGLFGPSYDSIYGPWGSQGLAVRTPESPPELLSRLPYPGANHPNLMESLSVETVHKAAEGLLERTRDFR